MPLIYLKYEIKAPITRVFDLSRSIDLHIASAGFTGEKAVAGRTSGLIEPGEEVTWRAKHFGVWQHLTSKIDVFDYPNRFRDNMVTGAFKSFQHDHLFQEKNGITVVEDHFAFEAPLGVLGKMANHLFLTAYMKKFLLERNQVIKRVAESDEWKRYLNK
ncbi:MAG: SRPBCC family protein [Calditrichia bacterium]